MKKIKNTQSLGFSERFSTSDRSISISLSVKCARAILSGSRISHRFDYRRSDLTTCKESPAYLVSTLLSTQVARYALLLWKIIKENLNSPKPVIPQVRRDRICCLEEKSESRDVFCSYAFSRFKINDIPFDPYDLAIKKSPFGNNNTNSSFFSPSCFQINFRSFMRGRIL